MKKINNFILISLFSLLLCSCQHIPQVDKYAHVTFKNYDDSVLYYTKVDIGEKVEYKGENPFREPTESQVFTFDGWDYDLTKPIKNHIVINAVYDESVREYLVTFKNYDDSILEIKNVPYGTYATYTGKTPTKSSNDRHIEFEFSGWNNTLNNTKITKDTTFVAQYRTNEFVFATFTNYDNSFLSEEKVIKGKNAIYTGQEPLKTYTGTGKKIYRFSGWDKSIENLLIDTTFVAQFELLNIYTVTFKNYDGSVLQKQEVVHGEDAVYTGTTPHKPSTQSGDYTYSYSFSGWSSSLKNIQKDSIFTAQFKEDVKVTGATEIKQHLNTYGSGSYHNVETGNGSTLGYSGSYFYVGYSSYNDGMFSAIAINFSYGASYGYATFQIEDNGILMYSGNMTAYVSSHKYSSLSLNSISVCKYSTDSELEAVALLSILASKFAINNASDYLYEWGLSYIY